MRAIVGKPMCQLVGNSLDPWLGKHFGGYVRPQNFNNLGDEAVTESAKVWIRNGTFRFLFVHLGDVDRYAHTGVWGPSTVDTTYTGAIHLADSLVFMLWKEVQSTAYTSKYRNKTLFLVTSDHGRMGDDVGGFRRHGELSHGSQHVLFLALGPDVKQDSVITTYGDQIDLVPTMMKVFGESAPLAQGRLLWEMFTSGASVSPDTLQNHDDEADLYCQGDTLYKVWTQRPKGWDRFSGVKPRSVWFARSTDRGTTWSDSTRISRLVDTLSNRGDVEARWPRVAVSAGKVYVCWLYRYGVAALGDATWEVYVKRNTDLGHAPDWGTEETMVASSSLLDSSNLLNHQPLTMEAVGDRAIIMYALHIPEAGRIRSAWVDFGTVDDDAGGQETIKVTPDPSAADASTTWPVYQVTDDCVDPQGLDSGRKGTKVYLTWYDCRPYYFSAAQETIGYWNVFVNWSSDTGKTWLTGDTVLSDPTGDTMNAYDPSIAVSSDDSALVVWMNQDTCTGYSNWRIVEKNNVGGWNDVLYNVTTGEDSCITPDVVATGAHSFACVWPQANTNSSSYDIRWKKNDHSGTGWTDPSWVQQTSGYSLEPKLAYSGSDTCNVIWQEDSSGVWIIRHAKFTP